MSRTGRPPGLRSRLLAWAVVALRIGFGTASPGQPPKQAIPSHPSQLEFPARTVEVPRAEPLTHRLSNGTPVVIVEDHSLPLVDVTVAILAGSFLDPASKPGTAELTAAMLRRGGTTDRRPRVFNEAIDFLGARISTRAGGTRAGASLDSLSETLEESLALFFDMLSRPAFDSGRLSGVKTNLLESFAARNDDPIALMEREWAWLLMSQRHYLGRQLTSADVEAIGRADLAAFHAAYWRPERAVIAVSGDVRTARVLELLEAEITAWAEALPQDELEAPWPPEGEVKPAPPGIYLADHASPQAKVSMGQVIAPIPDWLSPDTAALEVANEILGGTAGQVSRLNSRLRGQGWVYRVLSELDVGVYEPGSFRIFLDASPENVLPAVEVCIEEVERLRRSPVDPRQLATVQEEFLSALGLRFDSAEEIAGYFAEDILLGRPHEYWYGYAERVRSLKPRDLRAAAQQHLDPASLAILIVGGGVELSKRGIRSPLLTGWLDSPQHLPSLDPQTLHPVPASSGGPDDPS